MKANITFVLAQIPHPWNEEARKEGVEIWAIMKCVTPAAGGFNGSWDPIAIFNFDSDATLLARHCFDGGTIEPDHSHIELFKATDGLKRSRGKNND